MLGLHIPRVYYTLSALKPICSFAITFTRLLHDKEPGASNLSNNAPARSALDGSTPVRTISQDMQSFSLQIQIMVMLLVKLHIAVESGA